MTIAELKVMERLTREGTPTLKNIDDFYHAYGGLFRELMALWEAMNQIHKLSEDRLAENEDELVEACDAAVEALNTKASTMVV